jgi:hypothetical protein
MPTTGCFQATNFGSAIVGGGTHQDEDILAIVDFVGDVAAERAGERRRIAPARDREYARDVDAWRESTMDFICWIDGAKIEPVISDANYALWKTHCSNSKFTLSSQGYRLVIHVLPLRCLLHRDYLDLF